MNSKHGKNQHAESPLKRELNRKDRTSSKICPQELFQLHKSNRPVGEGLDILNILIALCHFYLAFCSP